MHFVPLLGRKLKDDLIVDVLESNDMEVVYEFDRTNENLPAHYWSAAKTDGFRFRFNATQTLDVVFLYCLEVDGFSPVDRSNCDIEFFTSVSEVEEFADKQRAPVAKGSAKFLGIARDWARIEFESYSAHYEFRGGVLSLVTIRART